MPDSLNQLPDEDGYITVPKREKSTVKGVRCGECGMKFDYGKAYGFCCGNNECPMKVGISL